MNKTPPVHFPLSSEHGPFPFPTTLSMAVRKAGAAPSEPLSAEDLRLMADTMPGDGPGD